MATSKDQTLQSSTDVEKKVNEDVEYRVCSLEEFLNKLSDCDDDGFAQPEDYITYTVPVVEEAMPVYTHEDDNNDASTQWKEGDISKLLKELPNCVKNVECFPKDYVPAKTRKQPAAILDDKIPIFLDEKYFKFRDNPNDKQPNPMSLELGKGSMGQQFLTVFNDSDSDEDNSSVKFETTNCRTALKEDKPVNNITPQRQYYNPFELYTKKRGKNNKNSHKKNHNQNDAASEVKNRS